MNGIDEPSMKYYTLLCICYLFYIQRPVHNSRNLTWFNINMCVSSISDSYAAHSKSIT